MMVLMQIKEDAKEVYLEGFWDDLFDGGYIKPENILVSQEDIDKVQEAMQTLRRFEASCNDAGIMNYI